MRSRTRSAAVEGTPASQTASGRKTRAPHVARRPWTPSVSRHRAARSRKRRARQVAEVVGAHREPRPADGPRPPRRGAPTSMSVYGVLGGFQVSMRSPSSSARPIWPFPASRCSAGTASAAGVRRRAAVSSPASSRRVRARITSTSRRGGRAGTRGGGSPGPTPAARASPRGPAPPPAPLPGRPPGRRRARPPRGVPSDLAGALEGRARRPAAPRRRGLAAPRRGGSARTSGVGPITPGQLDAEISALGGPPPTSRPPTGPCTGSSPARVKLRSSATATKARGWRRSGMRHHRPAVVASPRMGVFTPGHGLDHRIRRRSPTKGVGPAAAPGRAAPGLGDRTRLHGHVGLYGPSDRDESVATIRAALDAGVSLLDGGDFYGSGDNGLLIARALEGRGRGSVAASVKFGALRGPKGAGPSSSGGKRPSRLPRHACAASAQTTWTSTAPAASPLRAHRGRSGRSPRWWKPDTCATSASRRRVRRTVRRAAVHPSRPPDRILADLGASRRNSCPMPGAGRRGDRVRRSLPRPAERPGPSSGTSGRRTSAPTAPLPVRREPRPQPRAGRGATGDRRGARRDPAQVAIAWALARGDDVVPLVDARRRERLHEALGALGLDLDAAALERVEAAVPPGAASGPRYPVACSWPTSTARPEPGAMAARPRFPIDCW